MWYFYDEAIGCSETFLCAYAMQHIDRLVESGFITQADVQNIFDGEERRLGIGSAVEGVYGNEEKVAAQNDSLIEWSEIQ
jgi:hypothetical protein